MTFRKPYVKPERVMPTPIPPQFRREARMVTPALLVTSNSEHKTAAYRDQRIRDSARDEQCLIRMPGCIGHMAGATIWSHYRGSAGGKAGARKADDLNGAYACTNCDAIYDGQKPRPEGWTQQMVELAWHEAHLRSLSLLAAKGLIGRKAS